MRTRSDLSLLLRALVLAASALSSGCWDWGAEDPYCCTEPSEPPPPPRRTTTGNTASGPRITDVELPMWPPLGPGDELVVHVDNSSSGASSTLTAQFRNVVTVPVGGMVSLVALGASELGEGYGRLDLEIASWGGGGGQRRAVENLLVDLTPPTVEIERTVVSPHGAGLDGDIALWVTDAFVLGSVEMTFRGKKFEKTFPEAYPATLGTEADVSRVAFSAADLTDGEGTAVIVARDAAGNVTTEEIRLRVDGTPPIVSFSSPSEGTTASAPFDVVLAASDPGNTDVVGIDVELGGALGTSVLGPSARVTIDPATLPKGPLVVRATAIDRAGNRSTPATRTITIE